MSSGISKRECVLPLHCTFKIPSASLRKMGPGPEERRDEERREEKFGMNPIICRGTPSIPPTRILRIGADSGRIPAAPAVHWQLKSQERSYVAKLKKFPLLSYP